MVICIEGLDGAGKDTQIHLLKLYLEANCKDYIIINSCSSELLSSTIRTKLKDTSTSKKQLAGLFIAELYEHIPTIQQALSEGKMVILNRWVYSTMAYNSSSVKELEAIHVLSTSDIKVDEIIYLDIKVSEAMKRIKKRKRSRELFETEEMLREISGYYEYMKQLYRFKVIDANQPEIVVHKEVLEKSGFLKF